MATHPKKRAIDQLSLDPTIATPTKLRLEAIFHPKFENQTLHVRQQMLDRLRSCRGSLEATLKYSGSLLLWSGGDRFYSKNATDNIYTLVGEMLLQQHFGRAHAHYTDKNPHAMYQACRRHVDEHRLTLAFEVVTAVLGDHGQRPRRDFVILTAVADRSLGRFYSTAEMVELALQYRLPYNDAFLYTDVASAEALFRLYDQCWTSGRANEVMAGLRSTANVHVPSMMDHEAFQGDLLEGFVVRYVEGDCQRLTDLVDRAKELQRQVPSDLEDCFRLYQESDGRLWCTNIRDLSKQAQGSVSDLESKLRKLLDHESDCRLRRASPAQVTEAWSAAPLSQVLSSDPLVASSNKETRQIAQLVRRVSQLNLAVHYTAFCQGNRWLCGIHVLYDNCFMKYNKNKQPTDMPLYRGFVVELVGPNDGQVEDTSETEMNDSHVDATATEEPLMLKMKLLPYLLRTAGCRNGLRYLQKGGIEVYLRYARDWLSRSQVPSDVRESSLEFLKAWGFYAQSMLSGGQLATEYGKDLPPLTSDCYLDHYDLFERLYRDKIDFFSDKESAGDFRGLVVVVAIQRETADKAADEIAKRLEARREMGAPVAITEEQLLLMRERGRGAVYSCIVTDGIMRRLLKGGLDCISVVVVGCSSNEIAKQIEGLDVSLQKKSVGMLNAWRKVKWASISEVPWSAFTEESGQGATSLSDAIRSLLDVSSSLVKEDESPGLLVFFASAIPGCGKSSLLDSKTVASLEADIKQLGGNRPRPVVARMGDQTQGKFWPLVAKERLSAQSTVYIADKNVPSNTWKLVAEIGAKSKGVLVPVVYDSAVFQTTCINGLRDSNGILCGGKEHMYPFSLSFLAVCLARVSDRPAATHVGKLDSGTERASMIVIKFYTLYRHLTAEAFQDELDAVVSGSGAVISSTPVEVPFFASDDASDSIPNVLKGLLVEALQAQVSQSICWACLYEHNFSNDFLSTAVNVKRLIL